MYQLSQNSQSQLSSSKRSLNKDYRKRELLKITQENQVILRRLQLSQSRYNVQKWVDDHRKNEQILRNICQFPIVIEHNPKPMTASQDGLFTSGAKINTRSISLTNYPGVNKLQDISMRQSAQGLRQSHDRKSSLLTNHINPIVPLLNQKMAQKKITSSSDFSHRQADILDQNRIVHYKKGKYIKDGYFIIEISSNYQALFIAAFDVESPQSFLIQIPKQKASDIIDMFEKDFDKIATSLKLLNNKLVLINPRYKRNIQSQNDNDQRYSQMRSSSEVNKPATALQDASQINESQEGKRKQVISDENKETEDNDKEGDLGIYNDEDEDQIVDNPYINQKI